MNAYICIFKASELEPSDCLLNIDFNYTNQEKLTRSSKYC